MMRLLPFASRPASSCVDSMRLVVDYLPVRYCVQSMVPVVFKCFSVLLDESVEYVLNRLRASSVPTVIRELSEDLIVEKPKLT